MSGKMTGEDMGLAGSTTANDSRLKRPADAGRRDRALDDNSIAQDRELKDRVRASSRRHEFTQSILPDPPKIPGYHLIWLSTTNEVDPIPVRMQRGYSPVKITDVPGYESYSAWELKGGQWEGCLGIREMILFKIRNEDYADDMNYLHHEAPLQEEEHIRERVEEAKAIVGDTGKIEVMNGMEALAKKPARRPVW
jgi:hypothetical protein